MVSLWREILKNVFKKPVTIEFPKVETPIEKDFRGLQYADLNKCTGCSLCALECPSKAIEMVKLPEDIKLKHNPRGLYPVINYPSCVFCYRCVTICPVNAYITTNEYRMATEAEKLLSDTLSLKTLKREGL
uniref:4Fe-4S dicluster domain-containing protein n=1 Tax=Ignisphaera aggregans TaxID=334771 RepID=A0A7C4FI17_9CREN